DTNRVAQYLQQDLAQGVARGDSYDKLARNLRQRFGRVNRKDAYRLIYTEGTYVMAESTMQPFKEDFTKYRTSPVLDKRTSLPWRHTHPAELKIRGGRPAENFPPFHQGRPHRG